MQEGDLLKRHIRRNKTTHIVNYTNNKMRLQFIGVQQGYWGRYRIDFDIIYEDNEARKLPIYEKEFRLNCRNQFQ